MMNLKQNDNLNLQTIKFDAESVYSESDSIRNLKDENGRLMKLLQEKEFEIKKMSSKMKKQYPISADPSTTNDQMSSNSATNRIIELSKKLRELTAELEIYKTKYNEKLREVQSWEEKKDVRSSQALPRMNKEGGDKDLLKLKESLKVKEEKLADLTVKNDKLIKDYQVNGTSLLLV